MRAFAPAAANSTGTTERPSPGDDLVLRIVAGSCEVIARHLSLGEFAGEDFAGLPVRREQPKVLARILLPSTDTVTKQSGSVSAGNCAVQVSSLAPFW